MATYTADQAQANFSARAYYVGTNVGHGKYQAGGVTISSGDVYQMVKVPNGALITDVRFYGKAAGVGGIVFTLGTSADASLFGSVTISATHQFVSVNGASATQQMPYQVSLSDDATPQHIVLQLTQASGTATATGSFGLVVSYVMKGAGAL